jgi:DNA modification methylase
MLPHQIYFGDNLEFLGALPDESVDLIYIDPPFNTGKKQAHTQLRTTQSEQGDRVGFKGKRYETIKLGSFSYMDLFDDFMAFIEPRLVEAHRVLTPTGSLYFHIDYREVHYCKILLDQLFGRESFLNEIIWAYDYGARTKKKWPPKHDNILWYAKNHKHYTFNYPLLKESPTWLRVWSERKKQRAESFLPIPGGIPLSQRMEQKEPAIRRKNPWAFCGASSKPLPIPVTRYWISSPAAAPPAQPALNRGAGLFWWMTTHRQWR